MTIIEIKNQIEEIIRRSPYTKEEILSFLTAEEELNIDELMAYSVALEYLRGKKDANFKKLEKVFLRKKKDLIKHYL